MFQENIPLSAYSNYKIGGPARFFVLGDSPELLIAAATEARARKLPIFILGGGTNLLFSDSGFNGLVIKPALTKIELMDKHIIHVGAGATVAAFLDFMVSHHLSGFEWAGGLPGTMGGAIWGNAGAFGGEIKDRLITVQSLKLENLTMVTRKRNECQFEYRSSIFKTEALTHTPEIILSATFQLETGNPGQSTVLINEKIQYRQDRQPIEYPNIGSIFKNVPVGRVPADVLKQYEEKIKLDPVPVLPTAVLIGAAGLKEYRVGGAVVSPKHPNFIVNMGGATAADVKAVMAHVQTTVKEKFGVELEPEVIFV